MVLNTLRGMSYLLRSTDFDYFIPISSSDYPIVPIETMAEAIALAPPGSNFLSNQAPRYGSGWWLRDRARRVVVDPAVGSGTLGIVWVAEEIRTNPTDFRFMKGEPGRGGNDRRRLRS